MNTIIVTIFLAISSSALAEKCMSMNGNDCIRRDQSSQTWAMKKPGGDYCFDMFDNNVSSYYTNYKY